MVTPPSEKPKGWTSEHEEALKRHAKNGEEPRSIVILLETDFPELCDKVDEKWVKEKVKAVVR